MNSNTKSINAFYPKWLDSSNVHDSISAGSDSCNTNNVTTYRVSYFNKNKNMDLFSNPDENLKLKIQDFCHNHRNCLICDLNVNNQEMDYFVKVQREVACSGLPNYLGCRIPVVSNLKLQFIRSMLVDYDDTLVCDLLEFGFPLGHTGILENMKKPRNHSGARDFPYFIMKYLKKEMGYKAIIGPFKQNPFIFSSLALSPLNSVPKSTPGERRVITDLSFPPENSVNDGICKDTYLGKPVVLKYPSVDDLVHLIKQKGRDCLLFKRDLKRAYRQIPIDPGDVNLVGFHWKNHIFVDRVLTMGLRSSAHICQRVTSTIVFMMKQCGHAIVNYLDDLAGAESPELADSVFELLRKLLEHCGLEESVDKACPPSTVMCFLGVEFNTHELTLSVTAERVLEILQLVQSWLEKSDATVRDLQSLLGKLHFVSSCVRPGRLFVSRLLTWLRSLPDDLQSHVIPLYIRKDLLWWSCFLKLYNGVSMMFLEDWSQPDEIVESDATLSSCGGWFAPKREYFHVEFPPFLCELNLHINQCELLAIMICIKLWSTCFCGKKILLKCDNQTTVAVLNSGATKDSYMQGCLREILFFAAKFHFEVRAVYLPGVHNRTADVLSRWHLNTSSDKLFFNLPIIKEGVCFEKYVGSNLFYFSHDW